MTDDEIRQEVDGMVRLWSEIFEIADWHIFTSWELRNPHFSAQIHAMPEYREASIEFNLDRLRRMDSSEREEAVVHELIHAVTWPLTALPLHESKDITRYMDESVTTQLADAFMRMRDRLAVEVAARGENKNE